MTAPTSSASSSAQFSSALARQPLSVRLVNGLLAIKPLFRWVKSKARKRMVDRAEDMGIGWRTQSERLKQAIGPQALGTGSSLSEEWQQRWAELIDVDLTYPEYYQSPFHAYDAGNLSWDAATEVEVAARAVHATIWPDVGVGGDAKLRQSYHDVLMQNLPTAPQAIVDVGCSVGMSTFALKDCYPDATMTGVELSPYFLTIAEYRATQQGRLVSWQHAPAEATGLPSNAYDLVSLCLVCHELPQTAAQAIFVEARRLLRPNGHLAIMDINPQSEVHRKMLPYVFTLLKSTEPFLDDYFTFDIASAIADAGFYEPVQTVNSPRHRTIIARVR
ncbi:MAG: methyltransferase domain-containing protein [Cyanobacteria bacterium P01_E01_bin.34]